MIRIKKLVFINIIFLIGILLYQTSSVAFIPYTYEPKIETLEETSVSIAKTAAQLIQLGQHSEAVRLIKLAVRLKPNDDRLWALLAEAQIKSNKLKQANKSISKAKRINPSKASLWFAEGSIALRENNPKKALKALNYGLKLEPKNAGAYFQKGNANLMQNKLKDALHSFETAVNIKPNFWEALNNKGIVLFEMGK